MENHFEEQCMLAARGYTCGVVFRRSYRGSTGLIAPVISASKEGRDYLVHVVTELRLNAHLKRIRNVQDKIPLAAQILDIVNDYIFITERASGNLLWHIEENLPNADQLRTALYSFVSSLRTVGLVHGDIRPWNIFYEPSTEQFKMIDWGFSFFLSDGPDGRTRGHLDARGYKDTPPGQVDERDVEKILKLFAAQITYEEAWNHNSNEMEWRPKWVKRQE